MTDKEKLNAIRAEVQNYIDSAHKAHTNITEGNFAHLLSFIDSLQEEPVSEELEEACEQLAENARKHKAETSSPFFSQTDYKQGVIDGAQWQKQQMMAKAIDGIARPDDGEIWCDLKSFNFKDGDTVKVIVIKKD